MESEYWKTLYEVAETGSLSKAAKRLSITQSAVSRRIRFLEEQYELPLIKRKSDGVELTGTGSMVLEKATRILQIEEDLIANLNNAGKGLNISFCCSPSFGISYLPEIISEFLLKCPNRSNMQFRFEIPELIKRGIKKGEYDIAIIEDCECGDLGKYRTLTISPDDFVFISSPSLGFPEKIHNIDRLLSETLMTRKPGCCSRNLLEDNLLSIGKDIGDFKNVVILDDLNVILHTVAAGGGVSFLSTGVVDNGSTTNLKLAKHTVEGFRQCRTRCLVYDPARIGKHMEDVVIELFSEFLPKKNETVHDSERSHSGTSTCWCSP